MAAKRTAGLLRGMQMSAIALLAALAVSDRGEAQSASPEGSWHGGGWVAFASGQRERARCRARYSRVSRSSYLLHATCATAAGRATQTATVRRVGGNTYQGRFHNSEYDVSGTISVTVRGNRQMVRLTSDTGWASFELRR